MIKVRSVLWINTNAGFLNANEEELEEDTGWRLSTDIPPGTPLPEAVSICTEIMENAFPLAGSWYSSVVENRIYFNDRWGTSYMCLFEV